MMMILPDSNLFAADNFLWHDDFIKGALTSDPKGSDAQNRVTKRTPSNVHFSFSNAVNYNVGTLDCATSKQW